MERDEMVSLIRAELHMHDDRNNWCADGVDRVQFSVRLADRIALAKPDHPLRTIAAVCGRRSARWFPHLHDRAVTTEHEQLKHMALGLAEEAGEVAGVIKKLTGYTSGQDAHSRYDSLGHELADVLIYAFNIADLLGIDLDRAVAEKAAICEARWGSPTTDEGQVT